MSNSIVISVVADVGGEATETWDMSAGDMVSFQAFVANAYPTNPTEPAGGPDMDEAVALWAQGTLKGTMDNVTRYLKLKAATDAAGSVPPVGGKVT